MRILSILGSFVALAWLGAGGVAMADPIGVGDDDCSTCQGSIYELLYDPVPVSGNGTTTYEITLRIDTSGYDGDGVRIGEVAFKVSPSLDAVALIDAPGGTGEWSAILGGINANGCQDNANSGFACTSSQSETVATVPDGVYEWVFHVGVPTPQDLFTEMFQASVKARYLDAEGNKTGDLVSENITLQPIPEPGIVLLLGTGLTGLLVIGRPRRA
jgi:hypothetical protein